MQPDPMFAYRTGKTTLNDRFMRAQPGRWRVKVIARSGESGLERMALTFASLGNTGEAAEA